MKHYAQRDHMALGQHYLNHIVAMTREGLHAKSDIAAELAWRDAEIERLRAAPPATPAAQPADGWIAVGDRLPEPDAGEVLVWLTGGRCAFDEWHMHREDPIGMGGPTLEMGYMWRDYDFEEITHWRPLPAAPSTAQEAE